jgi:two-component system, chemotaxis family, chemotaxis protein CheY
MRRKVLLVGHCGADASYLKLAVRSAAPDADIAVAEDERSLRQTLSGDGDQVALVLLNRVLSYGFASDSGVDVIRGLKPDFPGLRMILVSNYAEAQADAVAAGALPGFGKRELGSRRVVQLLKETLTNETARARDMSKIGDLN